MKIVRFRDGRQAIEDRGVLLAVPTMHPEIPSETRAQVYELVLRRQFGAAYDLAAAAEDARTYRTGLVASIASLMARTPYAYKRKAA